MSKMPALAKAFRPRPLTCLLGTLCAMPTLAANPGEDQDVATVTVTAQSEASAPASYSTRKSASATGLDLSLRETPQTVSILTRSLMDDFGLNNINSALSASSGVVVEKVETDRTYYTARGFDITNFQVDGLGMPFSYGNVYGDIDTAIYQRVDAVYGANGLISGTGYPSATINFVRKRPTADFAASASLSAGSWDSQRLDADVGGALFGNRHLRGRMVAAYEDGDSYLDRYKRNKTVVYGLVEADLGDSTMLTLSYDQQQNKSKAPLWGALPLLYSDGSRTDYDVSASSAADWSYWNTQVQSGFVELTQSLSEAWQLRAALTHNELSNDGALFYVYGTPDRTTGLGLYSYPSRYEMKNQQNQGDLQLSGRFMLGGRAHELSLGLNWSRSSLDDLSLYGQGIGTALPALDHWSGNYPMPSFDASSNGSAFIFHQRSAFFATRLHASDALAVIAGARATHAESEGESYGVSHSSSAGAVTPYTGLVYDLTAQLSVYGSFAGIFTPQYQRNIAGETLAPVKGRNAEAGLKGEFFDKRLNASLALFRSSQSNLAESAGYDSSGQAYYNGIDANSKGIQLDAGGQITPRLQTSLGYTQLQIHGSSGEDVHTYTPRRLLRLNMTYRLPFLDALKLGASVSRQSVTSAQASAGTVRQSAYTLLKLMAHYDINQRLSLSANLDNVTNEKYLASMYWASTGQGYYGAPRNGSIALNWKY